MMTAFETLGQLVEILVDINYSDKSIIKEIETNRLKWYINSNLDTPFIETETFEVDRICDYRKIGRRDQFLIKWKPLELEADKVYPFNFPKIIGKEFDATWIFLDEMPSSIKQSYKHEFKTLKKKSN